MMMNEAVRDDLRAYSRTTLWSMGLLLLAVLLSAIVASALHCSAVVDFLIGGFVGIVGASVNVFVLGYAFLVIAIKKGKKITVLWPIIMLGAMGAAAFVLSIYFPACLLGFAFGLTAPLLCAAQLLF